MPALSQSTEAHLLEQLAQCFYTVVPERYKTYCSFTSAIAQTVLQQVGLDCQRVPCQVWYSQPGRHYVVGFFNDGDANANPAKWDGHVVCCTDNFLLDTATHHFQREFDVPVPDVAVVPLFGIRSSVLAHLRLNGTEPCGGTPRQLRPKQTRPTTPKRLCKATPRSCSSTWVAPNPEATAPVQFSLSVRPLRGNTL